MTEKKKNQFGPDYLLQSSMIYRIEFALVALAIVAVLHWRAVQFQDLDIGLTVLFALLPDIVFIPILLFQKNGDWPKWGAKLYNFSHTALLWIPLVFLARAVNLSLFWPMLGALFHLAADRAMGFLLRKEN